MSNSPLSLRAALLSSAAAVLSVSCASLEQTRYRVTHAADWLVAPSVLKHYDMEDIERAGDIWCKGTDGEFCPTFWTAGDDASANLLMGDCPRDGACYYQLQIVIEQKTFGDCVGVVVAHEIGHSIGLRFQETAADASGTHSWHQSSLMNDAGIYQAFCDEDWMLDGLTVKAFHRLMAWEREQR